MAQVSQKQVKIIVAVIILACSAFFVFYRLGHYALWDDEADTALFAKSVWLTGDTHAVLGSNIIAHTYGQELKGLRNRFIPPLAFYLASPFIGLGPEGSAFAARLPFAVCGLLTVAVMLYWLFKARASMATWLLMAAGILGNVSLMLYARQCRYYALATLLTVILAMLYYYRDHRRVTVVSIALVSLLLLASNYMFYAAVYACLAVDYFIWGRKRRPLKSLDIILIVVPQVLLGGILVSIYNPIGVDLSRLWGHSSIPWIEEKLTLLWWNLRDLNSCEYGVGVLLLLAPWLSRNFRDGCLMRGTAVLITYIFAVTVLSPQKVGPGLLPVATIRYLAPLIPLCIFLGVTVIEALSRSRRWLAALLAVLAFGTNVLHGGPLVGADPNTHFSRIIARGRFRSTVAEFVKELVSAPPSAYRETAEWINGNLREGETVWVQPTYASYPLMFHAPKALYAWQLKEKAGQFAELPDIHFEGKTPPDYVIAFGPYVNNARAPLKELEQRGASYALADRIDRYWYDLTRPELFWHAFDEIRDYSRENQAIYIYKRDR